MNRDELEKRTLEFSKNLINVLQKLPKNLINYKLIGQAIDSGTSIGANYREANASESPKDFKHKINISFKEAKETEFWLSNLITANPDYKDDLSPLHQESDELMRIFGKSVTTCRQNLKSYIKK
ncbi:four helix bundle protein [Patescibacteria group bacterium]|nr:four helix bundle protein [Patescibacteria group bacterium]